MHIPFIHHLLYQSEISFAWDSEHGKRQLNRNFSEHDNNKRQKRQSEILALSLYVIRSTFQSHQMSDGREFVIVLSTISLHSSSMFVNRIDLNIGFHHLLTDSNFSLKIDLTSLPRSVWKRYNRDIIENHTNRISMFRMSDTFTYDCVLLTLDPHKDVHQPANIVDAYVSSTKVWH